MKTSNILSALFISSALLTSACTPQDKAVVSKDVRAEIQAQNARKTGKGGGAKSQKDTTQFSLNDYALLTFLVERQVEAVELVQLVTEALDAKTTQYKVEKLADAEGGTKQVRISTDPRETLEYASSEGTWRTKATKSLDAKYVLEGEALKTLSIKGAAVKSTVDSADKKRFFVNLIEDSYELNLTSLDNAYKVEVKTSGIVNGAKGDSKTDHKISIELTLTLDKQSLLSSEVKVLSANGIIKYPGTNDRIFDAKVAASDLTVKVKGLCNEVAGSVKGFAGPKKTFNVIYDGEEIKIGNNWVNKLATCGHRPTVDLSRLQVY